jgi:hypothetical protein
LNRQEADKHIQENQLISQKAVTEKINIGLASVNAITARWVTNKCALRGAVSAYTQNGESKTAGTSMVIHSL